MNNRGWAVVLMAVQRPLKMIHVQNAFSLLRKFRFTDLQQLLSHFTNNSNNFCRVDLEKKLSVGGVCCSILLWFQNLFHCCVVAIENSNRNSLQRLCTEFGHHFVHCAIFSADQEYFRYLFRNFIIIFWIFINVTVSNILSGWRSLRLIAESDSETC